MENKDLCDFCGGELAPGMVNLDLHVRKKLMVCENLPAQVCNQCGEKYFDAEVSEKIDDFIQRSQQVKPIRYIPVPVFPRELVLAGVGY